MYLRMLDPKLLWRSELIRSLRRFGTLRRPHGVRPHLQMARLGHIARPNDHFDQYPPRIYIFVALLMILVILMQRPKSEGLGAAFGGGVTENIFGAQTTNVLTKITGWLAAIFFLLTFVLSILYAHKAQHAKANSAAS